MFIASGVTGGSQINCYNTEIIERTNLNNVFCFNTGVLTLPLITTNSTIKTQEELILIDSLMLFQRISMIKPNDNELKECFEFELTP